MAKINILPASVYNRIAAGEVVDRPYSVVKELVENAIDAGATEIQIYIEDGGKHLIKVVDNGCGIAYEDLHSAFLPHATSKIERASDLEKIMTLGFRGEAVASIASVSKMTITSRTENGKCYSLTSVGGEMGNILEVSGDKGTEVCVEDLFFNTPVRFGFLKTDKGEETDITNFVSRFILNRPEIAFTYYANGKKILQSFGGGREEALVNVYGAAILSNCYQIKAERHGIKIEGFIGNQNFSKPNKTYQSLFLNGRYIVNNVITTAITKAYSAYLMKRQYPFFVLYVTVPNEIVDVNVHPNKADVRFADNNIIFGSIYNVVSAVLDGNSKALEYTVSLPNAKDIDEAPNAISEQALETPKEKLTSSIDRFNEKFASKRQESKETKLYDENIFSDLKNENNLAMSYEQAKKEILENAPQFKKKTEGMELPFSFDTDEASVKAQRTFEPYQGEMVKLSDVKNKKPPKAQDNDVEEFLKSYPELYFEKNVLAVNTSKKNKDESAEIDYFAENKKYLAEMESSSKQNRIDVNNCRFAGKLFNTYLLFELRDSVYIIDQHAAHERLIFNRLKEQMKERKVVRQPMLVPYELNLNAFESAFIRDNLGYLEEIGFDIEEFGNTAFKVSSVPVDLQYINLSVFFNDILSDVSGYRSIKLEDLLKDKLASSACKAAVKGGMDLSKDEIDKLFALMDGDMGLKCPHGRPVVARMTKTELEKMFKRIV